MSLSTQVPPAVVVSPEPAWGLVILVRPVPLSPITARRVFAPVLLPVSVSVGEVFAPAKASGVVAVQFISPEPSASSVAPEAPIANDRFVETAPPV